MRIRKAKLQARERKIAWNQAIRESRVVNFGDGIFRSFSLAEEAEREVTQARVDGFEARIVPPHLAQD